MEPGGVIEYGCDPTHYRQRLAPYRCARLPRGLVRSVPVQRGGRIPESLLGQAGSGLPRQGQRSGVRLLDSRSASFLSGPFANRERGVPFRFPRHRDGVPPGDRAIGSPARGRGHGGPHTFGHDRSPACAVAVRSAPSRRGCRDPGGEVRQGFGRPGRTVHPVYGEPCQPLSQEPAGNPTPPGDLGGLSCPAVRRGTDRRPGTGARVYHALMLLSPSRRVGSPPRCLRGRRVPEGTLPGRRHPGVPLPGQARVSLPFLAGHRLIPYMPSRLPVLLCSVKNGP